MEKKNISFIYLAITVIIMTFSMRATNNMIITTVPLLAKIDLGFSRFLVGIISAVIYLFTFTVTFYINPRLNSRIRRQLFIGANFAILFSLISYYFANGITIWAISALAGLAYGIMMPNLITSSTPRWVIACGKFPSISSHPWKSISSEKSIKWFECLNMFSNVAFA